MSVSQDIMQALMRFRLPPHSGICYVEEEMDGLKDKIKQVLYDVAEQSGRSIAAGLDDDTVLLESGLDSLGFAIAVVRLEMDLGYDPFRSMVEPRYPRTFRNFVECYESPRSHGQ